MRITAITAHDASRRWTIELQAVRGPLTAIYGPPHSGKTAVADLVGHALFGKLTAAGAAGPPPEGELIIEDHANRYRVRRSQDGHGQSRLTVAALDGSPIDQQTIRKLAGNLPPFVLTPLCAVSFRDAPDVSRLLSQEFVSGFLRVAGDGGTNAGRRVAELASRRDLLAQELETRIATERRASKDLEARWRELDRLVREEQDGAAAAEQRLKAVENSLAETDSRLRYRRLELNVELRWQTADAPDTERSDDLDAQVARCRQVLAELNERESAVRARLTQAQTSRVNSASVVAEQQTWLSVSRQLAADLTGEVARLARASASQQCVCHDAHPRLRPIAETIARQLVVLEKSIEDQRQAITAAELTIEVDHLARAQAELRRHLEQLLDRSQAQLRGTAMARHDSSAPTTVFSAADAEQLESRRLELEHERFQLAEQVNAAARKLKVLRAERDAIERERAALLSARSIEHIQREMAHVQKKLENAGSFAAGDETISDDCLMRASDFVAQLTNGEICRLMRTSQGRNVEVVNHNGESVPFELLTAAQRDQLYLSVCLALLSVASRHGVWLPLVLDDPFERLDARAVAALAAVLEGFSRQGHQVVVFTYHKDAWDRLASVGAEVHEMMDLRRAATETVPAIAAVSRNPSVNSKRREKKPNADGQIVKRERQKKKTAYSEHRDEADGHIDAA